MELADVYPKSGHVQRLYCGKCNGLLDLSFTNFDENVSNIHVKIFGLPVLYCAYCKKEYLPDHSRFAIIVLHERAIREGKSNLNVHRRKPKKQYKFTKINFEYDSDDYENIPGLERPFDIGFLTPVFFNGRVLLKYDTVPGYRLKFSSSTYGAIVTDHDQHISFGINKNKKVVMWLGDIAKLPEAEQYYLRSENVVSDHSLGSEFYEGQIECVFTEQSREDKLLHLRSDFIEKCFRVFKGKIARLDAEVVELALNFNAPIVDTPKERRHVADILNKIHIEALDKAELSRLVRNSGGDPSNLGSLKLLQTLIQNNLKSEDISALFLPFFTLYDLRVSYSHLLDENSATIRLRHVTDRLMISHDSDITKIYQELTGKMIHSYTRMLLLLEEV